MYEFDNTRFILYQSTIVACNMDSTCIHDPLNRLHTDDEFNHGIILENWQIANTPIFGKSLKNKKKSYELKMYTLIRCFK